MTATDLSLKSDVYIDAPPEAVWRVFSDPAAWPRWSRVCTEVTHVDPMLWEVGARLAYTLRLAWVPVSFDVMLVASEPPTRVMWRSIRWGVTGTRTHTFEREGQGTRVTDFEHFRHDSAPIAWFCPSFVINEMSRAWLADLKREVERRVAEGASLDH